METISSIIIGIASGLFTYLLILFAKILFQRRIRPWFQRTFKNCLKLDGCWNFKTTHIKHHRDITLNLNQYGDLLEGFSTHLAISDRIPGDKIRTYKLEGRIQNTLVQLTGTPESDHRMGALNFTLQAKKDGRILVGFVSAYSTTLDKIIGWPCKLIRK